MERNIGPQAGYPCALAGALPYGEQILPIISSQDVSIPHSLGSTGGEAQDRRGINRASGVSNVTSQMLDQSFLGISGVIDASTSLPLGEVPNMSVPSESLESQVAAPSHTFQEGMNYIVDETLLERVMPGNGPISGAIPIAILGKNFPNNIPLYVRFGNNLAEAVSYARYESTYINPGPKNIYGRRGATSIH